MKVVLGLTKEFDRSHPKRLNILTVRALFWEARNMSVNYFRQRKELNLDLRLRTCGKIPESSPIFFPSFFCQCVKCSLMFSKMLPED